MTSKGTFIGRDPTCDLALPNDNISRRHAVVRHRQAMYEIEDLSSTNGTLVNGEILKGTRTLHDGDRLALADIEIDFRFTTTPSNASPRSRPTNADGWNAYAPTGAEQTVSERAERHPQSLRRQLNDAPGFSAAALTLAVGGSVVGTILTAAGGTGQWGTLLGAAVGPVVSTVFSTKRTGEKGRVRGTAIAILSLTALLITWAGFSVTDAAAGKSIAPGADDRSSTFPQPKIDGPDPDKALDPWPGPTSASSSNAILEVAPNPVDCGAVSVNSRHMCSATITYHGGKRLHIISVEVTGPNLDDFTPGRECVGAWLDPGEACPMTITFTPSDATARTGTLVVHQNLPKPDHGTRVTLTGTGTTTTAGGTDPDTCLARFVWREAVPDDHVCVPRETHSQTQQDNQLADSRRSPSGGRYGPDTCLPGFVWREAVPDDHVCVTPDTRTQAKEDNRLAPNRRVD